MMENTIRYYLQNKLKTPVLPEQRITIVSNEDMFPFSILSISSPREDTYIMNRCKTKTIMIPYYNAFWGDDGVWAWRNWFL